MSTTRARVPRLSLPTGQRFGRKGSPRRALDRADVQGVVALLLYLLASVLFFGVPVLGDIRHAYVGLGRPKLGTGFTDPSVYQWSLAWWPHALTHGLNPLFTRLIWAPGGASLAWTTSVPGASILAWPVTAAFGPVAAYNVWMLLAPALAGWTAYLLCRHVTGSFWPSLVGGYLFGFSSYELAQMTAHLNLVLVFPIPLAALLVLLRLEGRVRPSWFVAGVAGTVALQFSFSQEILFSLTLFGGLTLLLAIALYPEARSRLIRTAGWTALSYAAAGAALTPFLIALPGGAGHVPGTWPSKYATDLLNLAIPTRTALVVPHAAGAVADRFMSGLSEEGAYLGPLFFIVVLFALRARRARGSALLSSAFGVIVLASLGPVLRVGGRGIVPLPWTLTTGVPFARMALPARFMVHAWLVLGVIAAVWLAFPERRDSVRWGKWAVAGVCVVALLPNVGLPLWRARTNTPAFFSSGLYRRYLEPGRNTLVIPFASNGFSMLWHAETKMAFPMAGGYIAIQLPREYRRWAIVATFLSKRRIPRYDVQLQAFLGHMDIPNIVVDPQAEGPWLRIFGALPVRPQRVGGILCYRIPDRLLERYRHIRPPNIEWKALERASQ